MKKCHECVLVHLSNVCMLDFLCLSLSSWLDTEKLKCFHMSDLKKIKKFPQALKNLSNFGDRYMKQLKLQFHLLAGLICWNCGSPLFFWAKKAAHCMKSSTVDDSIKTPLSPYMAKLIVLFLSYRIEFYKSTLINILFAIKITELSGTFLEVHDLFVLSSTESLQRLTPSLLSLSQVHELWLRQPTAETSSSDT